ncbi:MAG: hypothetical protein ACRD1T_18560 [Acidimicrobiia bacterium]
MTDYAELVGLAVLVASVLLLAWQTWEVARQTRIANEVASAGAQLDSTNLLNSVLLVLVQDPGLRPYFYAGRHPPHDVSVQQKIEGVADMLADVVEANLDVGHRLSSFAHNLPDWEDYGRFLLRNSPQVKSWVTEHPVWFPWLAQMTRETEIADKPAS